MVLDKQEADVDVVDGFNNTTQITCSNVLLSEGLTLL